MRGMIAPRLDDAIAKNADCTTTRARMTPTLASPSRVCASSASVTAHVPTDDQKYNVRRLTASAIAPPYSPNTTIGTSPASPTRPTYNDECEIEYTCTGTATWVSIEPMNDVPCPISSRL